MFVRLERRKDVIFDTKCLMIQKMSTHTTVIGRVKGSIRCYSLIGSLSTPVKRILFNTRKKKAIDKEVRRCSIQKYCFCVGHAHALSLIDSVVTKKTLTLTHRDETGALVEQILYRELFHACRYIHISAPFLWNSKKISFFSGSDFSNSKKFVRRMDYPM